MSQNTLGEVMLHTSILRRGAVSLGLATIAVVHLLDLPGKWAETRYLGWGYILIIAASLVLMERVMVRGKNSDFMASGALALSVIVGFVINRTIGMPGAMDDIGNWLEPLGMVSLFAEGFVLWQAIRAVQETRLVNAEINSTDDLVAV